MIIVTKKGIEKKTLPSKSFKQILHLFHMCRFFANCTILLRLCTLKKKEGKWENKINALQLFLVRFHQNMFNYVLVRLKWISFWYYSAQTYIFYQVKNFSDDSSLQNYYILLQKKRRNSSWQKSWQITLVLRHFWHYSRSKDK